MDVDGASKAPKDKRCPYCSQYFTSSSLGRHLDLYIKSKNPKVPDGIHNVDEIRKLRGSITRRQPRGGVRRDSSAPRDSQAGSKRSCGTSDGESIAARSPEDGNGGEDAMRRGSNSQRRVFNRQIMKSSLDVKQRVQEAIDTAKAAELALREVMGSWRSTKLQADTKTTPFLFNPLSMDFPALCLQCLESPPTLFSSTPHSTSTSWSITPPGSRQNEALKIYFGEEIRKWKMSRPTRASTEGMMPYSPPQAGFQEDSSDSAESLERQVTEHLEAAFQVWNSLPTERRQELWILEMARSIDKRRKEVTGLQETCHSLKQENANLKSQVDHLNRVQTPRDLKVDEKMAEVWNEQSARILSEDRREINNMVAGAIERWRNVIVTSRTATALQAQRSLEDVSAPLKTPTSVAHPGSPEYLRSAQRHSYHQHLGQTQRCSPNGRSIAVRNISASSAGQAATASEPKTSAASTPAQSPDGDDSDEDADAEPDVEMEAGGQQYLSHPNTPVHHALAQMAQHPAPQQHQMPLMSRTIDAHVSAVRHSSYPSRASPYGSHSLLPSQQMHMTQQAFDHQLQGLENQLAHGHAGMGWSNH